VNPVGSYYKERILEVNVYNNIAHYSQDIIDTNVVRLHATYCRFFEWVSKICN